MYYWNIMTSPDFRCDSFKLIYKCNQFLQKPHSPEFQTAAAYLLTNGDEDEISSTISILRHWLWIYFLQLDSICWKVIGFSCTTLSSHFTQCPVRCKKKLSKVVKRIKNLKSLKLWKTELTIFKKDCIHALTMSWGNVRSLRWPRAARVPYWMANGNKKFSIF
jgi:hypothetical protein